MAPPRYRPQYRQIELDTDRVSEEKGGAWADFAGTRHRRPDNCGNQLESRKWALSSKVTSLIEVRSQRMGANWPRIHKHPWCRFASLGRLWRFHLSATLLTACLLYTSRCV